MEKAKHPGDGRRNRVVVAIERGSGDIEPVIRRRAALRTSMNLTAVHARDPGHDGLAG
jgi:hypothetical protein